MYWQPLWATENAPWSQPHSGNARQQIVNNFECGIFHTPKAMLWLISIIEVFAAFIGYMVNVNVTAPENERQHNVNRASTERQQSVNRASTERQQSVNRASMQRQQSVNNCGC